MSSRNKHLSTELSIDTGHDSRHEDPNIKTTELQLPGMATMREVAVASNNETPESLRHRVILKLMRSASDSGAHDAEVDEYDGAIRITSEPHDQNRYLHMVRAGSRLDASSLIASPRGRPGGGSSVLQLTPPARPSHSIDSQSVRVQLGLSAQLDAASRDAAKSPERSNIFKISSRSRAPLEPELCFDFDDVLEANHDANQDSFLEPIVGRICDTVRRGMNHTVVICTYTCTCVCSGKIGLIMHHCRVHIDGDTGSGAVYSAFGESGLVVACCKHLLRPFGTDEGLDLSQVSLRAGAVELYDRRSGPTHDPANKTKLGAAHEHERKRKQEAAGT